jgi:hypothetical protein
MFLQSLILILFIQLSLLEGWKSSFHSSRLSKCRSVKMTADIDHFVQIASYLGTTFHPSTLDPHSFSDQSKYFTESIYNSLSDSTDSNPFSSIAQFFSQRTNTEVIEPAGKVCPGFGEPGWAPFCFLNGNPVFKAFDGFQLFIQNSVVGLHDFLQQQLGLTQAYGPSIILFTVFVRLLLIPLNYQQISSTQMVTLLNPKIQEIREKFPDNKELQAQLTALVYQEAKVSDIIIIIIIIALNSLLLYTLYTIL